MTICACISVRRWARSSSFCGREVAPINFTVDTVPAAESLPAAGDADPVVVSETERVREKTISPGSEECEKNARPDFAQLEFGPAGEREIARPAVASPLPAQVEKKPVAEVNQESADEDAEDALDHPQDDDQRLRVHGGVCTKLLPKWRGRKFDADAHLPRTVGRKKKCSNEA